MSNTLLGRIAADLIKSVRREFTPRVTPEEAVRMAREHCLSAGWDWEEPAGVYHYGAEYEVLTPRDREGGNIRVRVDDRTGEILSMALLPL